MLPGRLRVAVNTLGFIAEDRRQAADRMFPAWAEVMTRIGRERGWPPVDRAQFDAACSPRGALVVGSPEQVADKLIQHHRWFGHQRTLLQLSVGSLPHGELMRSIELYATEVVPRVRRALGEDA
jgi:alkanesulfonate monooxygenase SsuD/methylene tetrahydromethanopterin reductase-like flavin-dependent oxidoreductase (luciferase family)